VTSGSGDGERVRIEGEGNGRGRRDEGQREWGEGKNRGGREGEMERKRNHTQAGEGVGREGGGVINLLMDKGKAKKGKMGVYWGNKWNFVIRNFGNSLAIRRPGRPKKKGR